MPLNVRLFILITLAMAGYFIVWNAWFVYHPSQREIALTARLLASIPQQGREKVLKGIHQVALYRLGITIVWYSVIVLVAFLAAFLRLNWARWTYVILFAIIEITPIAIDISYGIFDRSVTQFFSTNWYNPLHYKFEFLYLAAIACAFYGNASDWFKRVHAANP